MSILRKLADAEEASIRDALTESECDSGISL